MQPDVATELPDADLRADVCVVGAGPCGAALASALASRGASVVVLERGGGGKELPEEAESDPGYGDVSGTRASGLGGTARIWNTALRGRLSAKYAPLDPHDFEVRPWIPHSGWPFGAAELEPWWREAERVCGLTPVDRSAPVDGLGYPLLDAEEHGLTTGRYQYGAATRFTEDLPGALTASARVTLVTGATVVSLVSRDGGRRVGGVRWRGATGEGWAVADRVVLAAGAIENARLLLVARRDGWEGIADAWLGRGFMEHPIDSTLELVTRARALAPPGGFYSQHGVGQHGDVVGRIALTADVLRARELPNASVRLLEEEPALLEDRGLGSAARRLVPFPAGRRWIRHRIEGLARAGAELLGVRYRLLVDLEQAPSPENRVLLAGDCDALGVPRARLVWRWSSDDEARRRRVLDAVRTGFERGGVGRVRAARGGGLQPRAHHHMGTTRIAEDPERGVVAPDLRVHGVEGLYAVGSSVFPTGGWANPTLTAVALALRLSHRLAP